MGEATARPQVGAGQGVYVIPCSPPDAFWVESHHLSLPAHFLIASISCLTNADPVGHV